MFFSGNNWGRLRYNNDYLIVSVIGTSVEMATDASRRTAIFLSLARDP
jgi:hypothetical protein